MRIKKHTILFTGIITIISFLCYMILELNIYNVSTIFEHLNTNKSLYAFCTSISCGLFTSSCVALIIAFYEYSDTTRAALRNLRRELNIIDEYFDSICWYDHKISNQVFVQYFIRKYGQGATPRETFIECSLNYSTLSQNDNLYSDYISVISAFRNQIWETRLADIFPDFTNEKKEHYLNNQISDYEKEIEEHTDRFIKSLSVFSHYDVYRLQEAFDSIDYLLFNHRRKYLYSNVLNPLVIFIQSIKAEAQKIEQNPDIKSQQYGSLIVLNLLMLKTKPDHSDAYSLPKFYISRGKNYIDHLLNSRVTNEKLSIENCSIYHSTSYDTTIDILLNRDK